MATNHNHHADYASKAHHLLQYCDAISPTRMMIFGNDILHHNTEG